MADNPQIVVNDWLSSAAISANTAGLETLGLRIEVEREIDSTNAALKRRALSEDIHGVALFAETQTAGRGRLGRVWVSPPKSNIYLSLGWRTGLEPLELAGLSLAAGCAIGEGLERNFGLKMQLKWPNDLYLGGKKCGGVLIDLVQSSNQDWTIVVGVGLNVAMPNSGGNDIDQPWTDLGSHSAVPLTRNEVGGQLLGALVPLLSSWQVGAFSQWRESWSCRDLMAGHQITVQQGNHSISGRADGVDHSGALRVVTNEGLTVVQSGEASMLRSKDL
ncbi:MAG: biotin--[acetyl-CoA-carboxylase] ligase [Halieaceae bacterium]|nr:biotin--[acetyl-CoA-carboxylase] ligase [Halieaceae bacterium]